jgi:hypothetical protein
MLIQFRFEPDETHTRVHVYCGPSQQWLNLSGLLIFTNVEWVTFRHQMDELLMRPRKDGERRNDIEFLEVNRI